jgi:CheY-like chemotaxis protein
MDIELQKSKLNGIELTKLIRGTSTREELPDYAREVPVLKMPIIFLTGYGETYSKEQLLHAGGNDLLEKPVDFVELKLAMTKYNLSLQKGGG